jgi:hydrogenase expression/formation protein HypD
VSLELLDQFHDPALCKSVLERLRVALDGQPLRFMEVCGTHTVAIFRSGLRSILPKEIVHLSGPGCPVCVTHEAEINAFLDLAGTPGVIIATFGDLMRVPGSKGRTLKAAQAEGARVSVVYSPPDAIKLAADNPDATVVFLGVGFETPAPGVAASILMARAQGVCQLPRALLPQAGAPALEALLSDPGTDIDGVIMPGHVSAIIGAEPYRPVAERFGKAAAVAGFEPLEHSAGAACFLAECKRDGRAEIANLYRRVVRDEGNAKAPCGHGPGVPPGRCPWRGIGSFRLRFGSGRRVRRLDAKRLYGIVIKDCPPLPGCKCGEVLKGKLAPTSARFSDAPARPPTPSGRAWSPPRAPARPTTNTRWTSS